VAAHGGGQGRILKGGQAEAAVGPVGGTGAALPLVALNGRLEVVRTGEVVQLALQWVQILRVPVTIILLLILLLILLILIIILVLILKEILYRN
jgi:hypothetical protein